MNNSLRKTLIIGVLLALTLFGAIIVQSTLFFDNKLHIVFCDVGQGDGIFIRTPKGSDILIDGGPDDSIISCISEHMPFWDRTIELIILTHPHNDHFVGLTSVFDRYDVKSFATEKVSNNTASFKALLSKIEDEEIHTQYLYAGSKVTTGGVVLEILGPSKAFLHSTSPDGEIDEGHGFGNVITHVLYGTFDALFTGDSQTEGLEEATRGLQKNSIELFQVPHHGSKFGFNEFILRRVRPYAAVISVGAKNKYGHPTKEILKMLGDHNIKTFRTDKKGNVEVVSDGKTFYLK